MFRMQRYAVEKRGKSDENEEMELNEVYELSTVYQFPNRRNKAWLTYLRLFLVLEGHLDCRYQIMF